MGLRTRVGSGQRWGWLAAALLCVGLSGCATQANVVDLEREVALMKLRYGSVTPSAAPVAPAAAPALGSVRGSHPVGGVDLADNPTELLDLTVTVDQMRTEMSEIRGQMDELLYSLNAVTEENDARMATLETRMGMPVGGGGAVPLTGQPSLRVPPRFANPGAGLAGGLVDETLAAVPPGGVALPPGGVAMTPANAIAATRAATQVIPGPDGGVVLPGVMIAPRKRDLSAGSVSAQTAYDLAARDLDKGHDSLAAAGFANFLTQYPDSPRVPHATYSLALAYMRQGLVTRAVDVWKQQAETFPGHDTAPATLLALGQAYRTLDNIPAAEQALKRLIARFPTAEQAEQAKLILSELR